MSHLNNHFISNHVLKINVGFLLHEAAGYNRDIDFDIPVIRLADDVDLRYLRGTLRFTRTRRGILVQGNMHAGYQAQCERCLEDTTLQLDLEIEELFVYPPTPEAEFAVGDDGALNLAPLLREETIVHVPIRVVCDADCRGLCAECGQNLNYGTCTCKEDAIDPRFIILKQLQKGD
ncbi:MAG: DUF177 domain-containing protein [Anaerolineae bacterium]|nr:DUF177 domain-containing protein [Anaerolineae bacterium]